MIIFLFSTNSIISLYYENNKDKYIYVFIIFYKINKKLILYTYQTRYQIDIIRNQLFYFIR